MQQLCNFTNKKDKIKNIYINKVTNKKFIFQKSIEIDNYT